MATPPHLSPKLVVGVGSLLLTLAATAATMRSPGYPANHSLRSWPSALVGRLRRELPRGDRTSLAWAAIAVWSVLVSILHFGGVSYNIYTQLPWWDLLTHAMGGVGVGALLAMTFRAPTLRSPAWIPLGVLAIGAGFEVYEFVFKTFWYRWSLSFYLTDTVIDLVVNTVGAVVVGVAVAVYRRRIETVSPTDTDPTERTAEADTDAAAADPD
jgi:VanZ family protein